MIIEAASKGGGSGFSIIFIVIIAFALIWFLFVRPQKRRQTQTQRMLSDLRVGDDVLTAGGIYGRVTRVDEDEVRVEVAKGIELRVARRAIGAILTEHDEPQTAEEPASDDDESGERWQSAFDEDSDGDDSGEQKPG